MNIEILVNAHSVGATVYMKSCASRLHIADLDDHRQVEHLRTTEGKSFRTESLQYRQVTCVVLQLIPS